MPSVVDLAEALMSAELACFLLFNFGSVMMTHLCGARGKKWGSAAGQQAPSEGEGKKKPGGGREGAHRCREGPWSDADEEHVRPLAQGSQEAAGQRQITCSSCQRQDQASRSP